MKKDSWECWAQFYAVNPTTFSPEELTSVLGVAADLVYRKGDLRPDHKTARRLANAWLLKSTRALNLDPSDNIDELLGRLKDVDLSRLRALSGYSFGINILGYFRKVMPPLCLSTEHIVAFARLGLAFDIDLYRI